MNYQANLSENNPAPLTILHVISNLGAGGTEAVLYRLCTSDRTNTHIVISLQGEETYGSLLSTAGIIVECLEMPRGSITLKGIIKLAQLIRKYDPDAVQTWMYHADLIGGLVGRIIGIRRIFWGLHSTYLTKDNTKISTIFIARVNAIFSYFVPMRIISCSQKGADSHRTLGYAKSKISVIPNGYNLQQFTPNIKAGSQLRDTLGIPVATPLLGMVARFDVLKDHPNLISALAKLKQNQINFRCILVGDGITESNTKLVSLLQTYKLENYVLLLGQRNDIPAIMSAMDIHVLSSSSEAFPNVLCEAMACGTPCVSTDVGDAKLILGDSGWVVPPKQPELLYQAIAEAITEWRSSDSSWDKRKSLARSHILNNFSIDKMVDRYNRIWR